MDHPWHDPAPHHLFGLDADRPPEPPDDRDRSWDRDWDRDRPHDLAGRGWAWNESGGDLDRLTHLVYVDGRLVDTWSEPVRGTRWQHHADRFDAERRTFVPPTPAHEKALRWLDAICGGRPAVLALDAEPLVEDSAPPSGRTDRVVEAARLLDSVAETWWDPETSVALHRALDRVRRDDPRTVDAAASAAHVAGGVCWSVGKANGLFRPVGETPLRSVQEHLGLTSQLSSPGQKVRLALKGFDGWVADHGHPPTGTPHLEPLGHPDLLLARVRERLVRLRDRALAAAGPGE